MNKKTRNILRDVYLSFMGSFAKPHKGIYILGGHMSHMVNPSVNYMEELMCRLKKAGFCFIRFEKAVELIEKRCEPDKPYVAFSFDDGFSECYGTICPVLESYGINGMFFVNPGFIDGDEDYVYHFTNVVMHNPGKRPMSWSVLLELLSRGHLIGAHTIDHYMTNSNNTEELTHQIVDCKKIIDEKLGIDCQYFAWPFGRLDDTSMKAVDLACNTYKYVFSLTNHRKYFSFNEKVINRRHFEPFWPFRHVMYFLCQSKSY